MILRSRARPQTLLRAIQKPWLHSPLGHARSLHSVPSLGSHEEDFAANGVDKFLTAKAFKMNWLQYQRYLCDKLNEKTQNTIDEGLLPQMLLAKYSRVAEHRVVFNHASMAVNNKHFFETLSPKKTEPIGELLGEINSCFDSLENLRLEMLSSADAIFGNGFVWLMRDNWSGNLRILNTYNAGSPLPEAHNVQPLYDANTTEAKDQIKHQQTARILSGNSRLNTIQNRVGSAGPFSKTPGNKYPNSLNASPLLCVNVWEHMWVLDYGVLGKQQYLYSWWERIDWGRVHQNLNDVQTSRTSSSRMLGRPGSGAGSVIQAAMNR